MNFRAYKGAECVFGGHYTLSDDKVSLCYMPDSLQLFIFVNFKFSCSTSIVSRL